MTTIVDARKEMVPYAELLPGSAFELDGEAYINGNGGRAMRLSDFSIFNMDNNEMVTLLDIDMHIRYQEKKDGEEE